MYPNPLVTERLGVSLPILHRRNTSKIPLSHPGNLLGPSNSKILSSMSRSTEVVRATGSGIRDGPETAGKMVEPSASHNSLRH